MTEFLANIESQKSDWKENLTHENKSDENIEISDEDDQFEISSDENFEKKNKDKDEEKKKTAENSIMFWLVVCMYDYKSIIWRINCLVSFSIKFDWNCYFNLLLVILI